MDDDKLQIHLEATDDATPNITRVEAAFEKLREKYEAVRDAMEASGGFNISSEAMEATIKKMESSMAGMFDRVGAHQEAMAARMKVAEDRMLADQEVNAQRTVDAHMRAQEQIYAGLERIAQASVAADRIQAEASDRLTERRIMDARKAERELEDFDARIAQAAARSAEQEAAVRQRVFMEQRAQQASHVEAYLAGERLIVESAEKTAQDQILINRRAEQQLEDFDVRLTTFVERNAERKAAAEDRAAQQAIDAQSREDAARMRSIEQRQALEARAAQGGGIGAGIGGALGQLPGLAAGALGAAGGAAGGVLGLLGGAAQGGLNLLLAPIKGIGDAFAGMVGSIADAGKEMVNLIATGAGLYGVYQVVMQLQQGFMSLKQGVLDFQDVMVRVGSLTGANVAEIQDMSAAILQVSMATGRSATELGEAMYFIQSHGIQGAQALELLGNAAKLSAAGLGETNQIVRVVAGQMLAYGADVDQTTHYFDVFARTVQISAVPAQEVANTFARITPLAAALHIGIDELGADFATISQTGLNASRVMTDLIAVFNNFLKGGKQQQEALQGIGLSVDIVRKTLGDKGLIAAAEQIWQAADRDINAVSQVFGDRTRALVGYLALVEDGGKRADENLRKMQDSAGTTSAVFEAALTRVSVQWQRFTNIVQAFAIAAGSSLLGPIAADLNKINDALQNADFDSAATAIVDAFKHAGTAIMNVLDALGKSMFGSGMAMMEALAGGIFEGISTVLNAAVNAVADFIAGFLLGHSWPPHGPLASGNAGVLAWQQQYATTMVSNGIVMANAAADVAAQVNTELGKIGGGGSAASLKLQIAGLDQQLLPWKLATEDIKNSYEAMIHPLDRQIAAIQRIKDLEYERKQLGFEERDLELRMMRIRAEGDPQKRAQLAGQLARAQELREQHSIESQIATLNREAANLKPGRGTSPQEIALRRREIADELGILRIQQQQHRLVNAQLLGQYETKKQQLDVDKEGAKISHDAFDLEQKKTLQPLLEQRDKLKMQEQAELDIIDQQTQGMENQRKILEAHLRLVEAVTGANKAGAGGASPWRMPDASGIGDDLGVGVGAAMSKNIGELANQFSTKLSTGVSNFFTEHGPAIGAGLVGSLVGGMVGGIPGAIAGAAFGPKLLEALQERGVTGADLQRFADRFMTSLKDTFTRVSNKLNAHDFLGAIDEVMVTARAWIAEFQAAFFREWEVSNAQAGDRGPGGREGAEATTRRFTGLGRTIIEAMFGPQDHDLNFARAYELVNENVIKPAMEAIQKAWADFTAPTAVVNPNRDNWAQATAGPSQAEQIGRSILGAIDTAVKWVGTNLGPVTEQLGTTIAKILGNAMATLNKDEQFQTTAGDFFENLGGQVAGRFVKGFIAELGPKLFDLITGKGSAPHVFDPKVEEAKPLSGTNVAKGINATAEVIGGAALDATGLRPLLTQGISIVQGIIAGVSSPEAQTVITAGLDLLSGRIVEATQAALQSGSPARVMLPEGQSIVEGINQGIEDNADLTGPIVRMWLRSEVIAQARSVLLIGEGKSGGLPGVAREALNDFADVFGTTPPSLANNLDTLGRAVVTNIMDPIVDPKTGLVARMQRTVDAMGRVKPQGDTLPTPEAGQRYAATGQDFVVGGTGGTDSEHLSMWATPGERVTVGARGGGGGGNGNGTQVTNHFQFNINGGDPEEVRQAVAAGIQEGMGEHSESAPNQLLNAWRTAKAQGANKPYGTQSRGARG